MLSFATRHLQIKQNLADRHSAHILGRPAEFLGENEQARAIGACTISSRESRDVERPLRALILSTRKDARPAGSWRSAPTSSPAGAAPVGSLRSLTASRRLWRRVGRRWTSRTASGRMTTLVAPPGCAPASRAGGSFTSSRREVPASNCSEVRIMAVYAFSSRWMRSALNVMFSRRKSSSGTINSQSSNSTSKSVIFVPTVAWRMSVMSTIMLNVG